ncbi:MAG: hypothetical protein ACI33M_00415 [Lysinibacillus sp.]
METYEDVLQEITAIDAILAEGYKFKVVYENLSGTFAELENQSNTATLQILTAEARKYLAVKLNEQVSLT